MQENQTEQGLRPINPAKEYMRGYRQCVSRIRALIAERDSHLRDVDRYDAAWERATKATSRLRAVSISGTPMHDGMANAVMDMMRYEAAAKRGAGVDALTDTLNTNIAHAAEQLAVRLALIDQLSDERYKAVIVMRYVSGWSWNKIAQACDLAENGIDRRIRTVYSYHGYALAEIRAMMKNCSSLQ